MKTHFKSVSLVLGALLLGMNPGRLHAQFVTVTAGAESTNAGAKLQFVEGTNYAASSGALVPLTYQRLTSRYYTNYVYGTTNVLFQALSAKTNPATAAAFGAYLVCQIMSVTGPDGGVLNFWEQGAKWPTYQFPVGGTFATDKSRFILSNVENGAGRPDGDPFGNIRGRLFTVNKDGEYLVTFKLYDTSENNPTAAAPIHTESDPLTIKFVTGVDLAITGFTKTNDVVTMVFKQGSLTNLFVETSTNLPGGWSVVGGPFTDAPIGSNLTTMLFTNSPTLQSIFYRLRGVTP